MLASIIYFDNFDLSGNISLHFMDSKSFGTQKKNEICNYV